MPAPADIAAHAATTIRSLTDEQLLAIMSSSQNVQKRVLGHCWATVCTAAPELAGTLDDLHSTETAKDLPRFEALAAAHDEQISQVVKGPKGKLTAALIIGAFIVAAVTGLAVLAGFSSVPVLVSGAALAAGMLVAGYVTGHRLSQRSVNWMFADPGLAASIVWDAGIDAAAAAALSSRAGTDGLTPDVLRALSIVWTGAGLDTAGLRVEQACT